MAGVRSIKERAGADFGEKLDIDLARIHQDYSRPSIEQTSFRCCI